MRHLFYIAVFCLITQHSFAQDKIVKLNGETINCKVTEIAVSTIKYKGDGEDFIRNVFTNKVQEIVFKSGKVEKINNNIVINGEGDWDKIQIVNTDFDVTGLTKGDEIKATVKGSGSTSTESKALQKLKRIAASKGYHTIVILNTSGQGSHSGKRRGGYRASITGVGYTY